MNKIIQRNINQPQKSDPKPKLEKKTPLHRFKNELSLTFAKNKLNDEALDQYSNKWIRILHPIWWIIYLLVGELLISLPYSVVHAINNSNENWAIIVTCIVAIIYGVILFLFFLKFLPIWLIYVDFKKKRRSALKKTKKVNNLIK